MSQAQRRQNARIENSTPTAQDAEVEDVERGRCRQVKVCTAAAEDRKTRTELQQRPMKILKLQDKLDKEEVKVDGGGMMVKGQHEG